MHLSKVAGKLVSQGLLEFDGVETRGCHPFRLRKGPSYGLEGSYEVGGEPRSRLNLRERLDGGLAVCGIARESPFVIRCVTGRYHLTYKIYHWARHMFVFRNEL